MAATTLTNDTYTKQLNEMPETSVRFIAVTVTADNDTSATFILTEPVHSFNFTGTVASGAFNIALQVNDNETSTTWTTIATATDVRNVVTRNTELKKNTRIRFFTTDANGTVHVSFAGRIEA